MDNKTNFKKLVVFDFNLDWKDYSDPIKYKDLSLVYPLIKQASEHQTVVLSTSACLIDAIDFARNKGIDKGFIIASGGAVIYDIENKKIVSQNNFDEDEVNTTFHHGMMLSQNVIITTTTEKFFWISNLVPYQLIKQNAYSPFHVIKNYQELKEILAKKDIVDITFANLVSPHKNLRDNFDIYKWERFFDNEINNLIIKINQSSIFAHITKKESTKLKALFKIMSLTCVNQLTDILYIAASCINKECFINFKNAIISNNPDFEAEISSTNKFRHYLSKEIDRLDPEFGLNSDSFWK